MFYTKFAFGKVLSILNRLLAVIAKLSIHKKGIFFGLQAAGMLLLM